MEIHDYFLREILKSNQGYWVVAKARDYRAYGKQKENDLIFLISLPHEGMPRQVDFSDLTMREIEKVLEVEVNTNIVLNDNYAPFQMGQRLGHFYSGFNVNELDINEFVARAWGLKAKDIWSFEKLKKQMVEEKQLNKKIHGE